MAERFYPTDTPQHCWLDIRFSFVSEADYKETHKLLGANPELRQELGASGLYLATRIRQYNFGTLADEAGTRLDDKKNDPVWLACETACVMDSIEQEAARTASYN